MNTADLVDAVAADHGLTKSETRSIVDTIFAVIGDAAAKGQEVALPTFGKFRVKAMPARAGRHPRTGEPMRIDASKKIAFAPAKSLKDKVNS
jgi:DNA-binding protein HU-beta